MRMRRAIRAAITWARRTRCEVAVDGAEARWLPWGVEWRLHGGQWRAVWW